MTSATSCSLGLSSPLEIHLFQALLRQENNRNNVTPVCTRYPHGRHFTKGSLPRRDKGVEW